MTQQTKLAIYLLLPHSISYATAHQRGTGLAASCSGGSPSGVLPTYRIAWLEDPVWRALRASQSWQLWVRNIVLSALGCHAGEPQGLQRSSRLKHLPGDELQSASCCTWRYANRSPSDNSLNAPLGRCDMCKACKVQ